MRLTIRNQILFPVAGLLLAAVALTSFSAAYLAAKRSEREIGERLQRVTETLDRTNFPYSQNVLEMMQGLSGADFVALDPQGTPSASTLPDTQLQELQTDDVATIETISVAEMPVVNLDGRRYFAARQQRIGPQAGSESLLVLYPEDQLRAAQWDAAWPPLVIGSITLLALVGMSVWVAARIGRRIRGVQEQVARIADGDFRVMSLGRIHDEIFELIVSINRMSEKLREFETAIRRTERSVLLGQLAGGLAHQLRNAVTGARMAVQIHQRRCQAAAGDESLTIALREMEMTEEHIKRLLSVGRTDPQEAKPRDLREVLDDVAALVSPVCVHANVTLSVQSHDLREAVVADADSIRTALMNLVLNAIEAATPQGTVVVDARRENGRLHIDVIDNGPGPPAHIRDQLFEPFITGKTEGVGLGLALVKQLAEQWNGSVTWSRRDDRTRFRLEIPEGETAVMKTREKSLPQPA